MLKLERLLGKPFLEANPAHECGGPLSSTQQPSTTTSSSGFRATRDARFSLFPDPSRASQSRLFAKPG